METGNTPFMSRKRSAPSSSLGPPTDSTDHTDTLEATPPHKRPRSFFDTADLPGAFSNLASTITSTFLHKASNMAEWLLKPRVDFNNSYNWRTAESSSENNWRTFRFTSDESEQQVSPRKIMHDPPSYASVVSGRSHHQAGPRRAREFTIKDYNQKSSQPKGRLFNSDRSSRSYRSYQQYGGTVNKVKNLKERDAYAELIRQCSARNAPGTASRIVPNTTVPVNSSFSLRPNWNSFVSNGDVNSNTGGKKSPYLSNRQSTIRTYENGFAYRNESSSVGSSSSNRKISHNARRSENGPSNKCEDVIIIDDLNPVTSTPSQTSSTNTVTNNDDREESSFSGFDNIVTRRIRHGLKNKYTVDELHEKNGNGSHFGKPRKLDDPDRIRSFQLYNGNRHKSKTDPKLIVIDDDDDDNDDNDDKVECLSERVSRTSPVGVLRYSSTDVSRSSSVNVSRYSPAGSTFSSRSSSTNRAHSELQERIENVNCSSQHWMRDQIDNEKAQTDNFRQKKLMAEIEIQLLNKERKKLEDNLEEDIKRRLKIVEKIPAVVEDLEDEEEELYPELTSEMEATIDSALVPRPAQEILVEHMRLQIRRTDIQTLSGTTWLNDEVINFHMNLMIQRGEESDKPKVHAFNTFFYPKLRQSGHSPIRRWTKKVDIFNMDYVVVPVHLQMHWCMAVIDFGKKEIRYYDSMGGSNDDCLVTLRTYLEEESLDKKKQKYDTSDWKLLSVKGPQQMNGSDCGVFSTICAEHITRGSPLTYSQDLMPYFRRKMILEILTKKLLQ